MITPCTEGSSEIKTREELSNRGNSRYGLPEISVNWECSQRRKEGCVAWGWRRRGDVEVGLENESGAMSCGAS